MAPTDTLLVVKRELVGLKYTGSSPYTQRKVVGSTKQTSVLLHLIRPCPQLHCQGPASQAGMPSCAWLSSIAKQEAAVFVLSSQQYL